MEENSIETPPTSFEDDDVATSVCSSNPANSAEGNLPTRQGQEFHATTGSARKMEAAEDRDDIDLTTDSAGALHSNEATQDDLAHSDDTTLSDGREPTPLEYAQQYGLVTDHLAQDPFNLACLPSPPQTPLADLQDPAGVLNIGTIVSLNALNGHTTHEKWDIDKDSAEFIGSIIYLGKEEPTEPAPGSDGPMRIAELKLIEPILSTDPELDLLRLKQRNAASIRTHGMKPFKLDANKNESIDWPAYLLRLPAEKDQELMGEKLDLKQDTMEYLKAIAMPSSFEEGETEFGSLSERKIHVPLAMTPPLMPLSPPLEPADLSQSVANLELTSTPDNLIKYEAANLEQEILACDRSPGGVDPAGHSRAAASSDLANVYGDLKTPAESSSSPLRRKRMDDLKVDPLLLPQRAEESATKKLKTAAFPEEIRTTIPSPEHDALDLDEDFVHDNVDDFMANVMTPFVGSANARVNDDDLDELDTTMRITVPPVADVSVEPPWGPARGMSVQKTVLSQTRSGLSESERKWGGVSKIERLIPWSPFPGRLGKVQIEETFDDASLARYMAEITFEDANDVDALVWKPEGLRILDSEDDDTDDLEALSLLEEDVQILANPKAIAIPQPPSLNASGNHNFSTGTASVVIQLTQVDMQTLLKKRKMQLDRAKNPAPQSQIADATHLEDTLKATDGNPGIMEHARLTTGGGLSSFLHLQGQQTTAAAPQRLEQTTTRSDGQRYMPPAIDTTSVVDASAKHITASCPIPVPEIVDPSRQISVVLSSNLIGNRSMVRELQDTLPALDMIERDQLPLTTARVDGTHAKATQNGGSEADITISPSTGLILTSLQKLKQKPLPGQASFFGIRERIETTSLRYERLIVLVSGSTQAPVEDTPVGVPLDNRDTEALSDLARHVSSLEAEVEIYYVPGDSFELSRWIAACIARHTVPNGDTKLFHDETLWERTLRQAGMNAFAAQCILAKLKEPETGTLDETSSAVNSAAAAPYGLAAFVRMTHEQRVQRFGPMMGGDNVLIRVGEIMDGEWISAADRRK